MRARQGRSPRSLQSMKHLRDQHDDDEFGPVLRPSRVEGWGGLAGYLEMIGISISANALEIRCRRYGLPARGGGVQGRPVSFTTQDLDAWVRHLRGLSLVSWLRKYGASRRSMHAPVRVSPGQGGRAAILPLYDLYAVLVPYQTRGEQVLRTPRGSLYASKDACFFEDVFRGEDPPPGHWSSFLFRGARLATSSDLRPMSVRQRKRVGHRASRLVGAFSKDEARLRWVQVPGEFFGLEAATTPLLASRALPKFGEAVAWISATVEDPVFVTWPRRVRVLPVTLEEVPGAGWTDFSDLIFE